MSAEQLDAGGRQTRIDIPHNMPMVTMSELAWENYQERWHRKDKRYCWIIGFLIAFCFLTNLAWLCLWNQYDTVSITNDGGGNAYYNEQIEGDIYNGENTR